MERNSLRLVLVARSEAGLAETASQAKAAWDGRSDAAATLETVCITADLGDLTTLDATLAIICSAAVRVMVLWELEKSCVVMGSPGCVGRCEMWKGRGQ